MADIKVSITVNDYYKLPRDVQRMCQTYAGSNPFGIPVNGVVTWTMSESRWAEIQDAMKRIEAKKE